MTERQKRFVDYYIQTGNATEAARKAGYSENYTNNNAQKVLQSTTVQNAISERVAALESKRIADAEEVLTYLTAAMRGQISEEVIVIEGTGNGESSARVETKQLSAATRTKAAELLAKRYGLLLDKKELTGAGGTALTVRWMKSPDEKVTQ
jgi:phage terminase small subunit